MSIGLRGFCRRRLGGLVENDGNKVLAVSYGQSENVRVVETGSSVKMVEHDVMWQGEHGRVVCNGLRVEESAFQVRRQFHWALILFAPGGGLLRRCETRVRLRQIWHVAAPSFLVID